LSEHHDGDGNPPGPEDAGDSKSGDRRSEEPPTAAAQGEQPLGAKVSREELEKKVERLSAMLEDSMRRARETQERLKDTHERLLRTAAEFDNFKKRTQKEKEDARRYAIESLLKDFLPVADNLERALEHAEEHDPKQVLEGVRLVQKMLEAALAKHGVVGFSARGQTFDPNLHEALMQQESDAAPGTVVSEMAKGYKLHDRLVRPAAVVVAKPRTTDGSAPGNESAGGEGST
jgi:molecular chaperone GrpE